jgi:hypothetical protein
MAKEMTLSRSVMCSFCHNSAEDEFGRFKIYAPDCTDQKCSRVAEPNHYHTTYSRIACHDCARKVNSGEITFKF